MPIISSNIYYQDRNDWYPRAFTLWVEHPKLLVAVVMPLEPGLRLSHLRLVLDQEEGAIDALGVPSTSATRYSIARPSPPAGLTPWQCPGRTQSCSPKSLLEDSPGRVICQLNRLKRNNDPLLWGGGNRQMIFNERGS